MAYYAQGQIQAAIAYYQRALAIAREVADLRSEGTLLGNLGLAYSALQKIAPPSASHSTAVVHSRAVDYYQQALAIAREVDDRRAEGMLLGHLADAYRDMVPGAASAETGADATQRRSNLHTAVDTYQRALVIVREAGDRRREGDLLSRLGNAYYALGERDRAIDIYQQALDIARAVGDRRAEGARLGNLGNIYLTRGRTRDPGYVRVAVDLYQQALDIARAVADRRGEGTRLGNLGVAYYALSQSAQAGQELPQNGRNRAEWARADHAYPGGAATSAEEGSPGERDLLELALGAYLEALDIAREVGDRRAEGHHLGHLGLAYSALSARDGDQGFERADDAPSEWRLQAAIEAYQNALVIAREVGDRRAEGRYLGYLGDAYGALGRAPDTRPRDQRPAAARECYSQALAVARALGDRLVEASLLDKLAAVYGVLGEREQAVVLIVVPW